MNKLKDYWRRWCLCYNEYGFWFSVKKTFKRIRVRLSEKKVKRNDTKLVNRDNNKQPTGSVNVSSFPVMKKNLNIGIKIEGGVGDYVIAANYIYEFKKKYWFPGMSIEVFSVRGMEAINGIFGTDLVDGIYQMDQGVKEDSYYRRYDLFFRLSRYPICVNKNPGKIQMFCPQLFDILMAWDKFKWKNPRFFDSGAIYDGQAAMMSNIIGHKRIQQADIDGILGITEEVEFCIPVRDNEEEYLHNFNLNEDDYIVFVASADVRCGGTRNNKVWPEYYLNVLISNIKEKYPNYTTVLVGDVALRETPIEVDLDLSGKTKFEDVKIIIKNAKLLISGEGGMVHLRHALTAKPSIVLFGPTDMDFYGYSTNINIRTSVCKHPCEWFCRDWFFHCTHIEPKACLWSLTPKLVMEKIDDFFEKENQR